MGLNYEGRGKKCQALSGGIWANKKPLSVKPKGAKDSNLD
jgi:hypothetical protein